MIHTDRRTRPKPQTATASRMRSTLPGHDAIHILRSMGNLSFVGAHAYQQALRGLTDHIDAGRTGYLRYGVRGVLVPETGNPHSEDGTAVALVIGDYEVGHLSARDSAICHTELLALEQNHGRHVSLLVTIAGAGMMRRKDGTRKLAKHLNARELRVFLGGVVNPDDTIPRPEFREITKRAYRTRRIAERVRNVEVAYEQEPRHAARTRIHQTPTTPITPPGDGPDELMRRLTESVEAAKNRRMPTLTVIDGGLS